MNVVTKIDPAKPNDDIGLPDFCNVYTVFLGVVLTELLAFVIVLVPVSKTGYDWELVKQDFITDLAMVSLFVQWVTLGSFGLLCLIRRQLCQSSNEKIAIFMSYLLILMVTWWVSELAWQLNESILFINSSWSVAHYQFLLKNFLMSALVSALVLSYIYQRFFWKKDIVTLSYVMILMVTLVISEWLSFFQMTPSWHYQEAVHHQLFLWRNLGISAIISAIILRYFYVQYHWKKQIEANAYARAQALQARIRPHFLFNSMNTIASLIRFQPQTAEQVVEDFAELFRASLVEVKTGITFQEELALCRQYLNIEALRFGERLQVVWQINQIPEEASIPPLCLQPLLENAIYHGIQPLPEGGTISITGQFDGRQIQLDIKNPIIETPSLHQGNRMAQHNIHQRLQAYYGTQAQLSVQTNVNIYHVRLSVPYRKLKSSDENSYR